MQMSAFVAKHLLSSALVTICVLPTLHVCTVGLSGYLCTANLSGYMYIVAKCVLSVLMALGVFPAVVAMCIMVSLS